MQQIEARLQEINLMQMVNQLRDPHILQKEISVVFEKFEILTSEKKYYEY